MVINYLVLTDSGYNKETKKHDSCISPLQRLIMILIEISDSRIKQKAKKLCVLFNNTLI